MDILPFFMGNTENAMNCLLVFAWNWRSFAMAFPSVKGSTGVTVVGVVGAVVAGGSVSGGVVGFGAVGFGVGCVGGGSVGSDV